MTIAETVKIGVGEVRISARAREYVNDCLDNNRLSYGKYARRFESEFAHLHNRAFAVFLDSGTAALQVGLAALKEQYGWPDGAKVLVPALTFVASYNVIVQNRLTPVLVDIRLSDYGMDRELMDLSDAVAVMPVHLFGRVSDTKVREAAQRVGVKVIADSCETMFMRDCAEGEVSCFSTYSAHIINTGVGGIATTNDAKTALLIRSLANHGRNGIYTGIDDALGNVQTMSARFQFDRMGYSYRATELQAAIGCAELEDWAMNIAARRRNAANLVMELADLPLLLPRVEGSAHMMLPILAEDGTRDALCAHLEQRGIETRPMLPLTNQPYLRGLVNEDDYPVAQMVNKRGFYVGTHPYMTASELDQMVCAFRSFYA